MPTSMVWSSRRPLYKLNLVVLMTLAPFNLLGMLLPFWLETKAVVSYGDQGQATMQDMMLSYGIWRLCADSLGCRWVHDDRINAGVGAWMYPIKVFMVVSVLCHLCASLCGALQNFLPRDYVRHWRNTCLRPLLHRDSPYAEDIGFLAGFFGTLSCIIFMLSTKDKISDGAHYQWGFALAFMSSSLTVMATLTLTKAHIMTAPRPPNTRRSRSTPNPADSGRDGGASSTPGPQAVLRTDDIHLAERQTAAQAQAQGRTSARRTEGHLRFSDPRRRRSRSRSRSRDRHSNPRPRRQSSGPSLPNPARLVRSPELENIPAAVTPSSASCPPGAAAHRRSRSRPIMCLQMSDLQSTASSAPQAGSANSADGQGPSARSVPAAKKRDSHTGNGRVSESSRNKDTGSHSSELPKTESEAGAGLPSGNKNVDAQAASSVGLRAGGSTGEGAVASDNGQSQVVETERL